MSGDDRDGTGGPQIHCHICSASLPRDATFCLQCGSRVRAVPPAPTPTAMGAPSPLAPPTPAPARHATMLGVAPTAPPISTETLREVTPAGAMVQPTPSPPTKALRPRRPLRCPTSSAR
nr:hypothetical protein [Deltaproteobacteria bacterium]